VATPRLPTLKGKIRSMNMQIPVYTTDTMHLNAEYLGLNGSPTKVVKINTPKVTRGGRTVTVQDDISLKAAVDELMDILDKKGVLP
jgi:electron transfer flavoprotein beta subunit